MYIHFDGVEHRNGQGCVMILTYTLCTHPCCMETIDGRWNMSVLGHDTVLVLDKGVKG